MLRFAFLLILGLQIVYANVYGDHAEFRYKCLVDPADSTGFYKIHLDPLVLSKLTATSNDLRLFDPKGKEVPYIPGVENGNVLKEDFLEYKIISRQFRKDSISELIFQNPDKRKLDNILLLIRNASAHKSLKLTGSFDLKKWFVVKEAEQFNSIENTGEVSVLKMLDFPLTDYLYYKIEINDKYSEPLDIITVGRTQVQKASGKYSEFAPGYEVIDSISNKTSWVFIRMQDSIPVDLIELKISEPEFFLRDAIIRVYKSDSSYTDYPVVINSKNSLIFNLNGIKAKNISIRIDNKDNPPIKLSEVRCKTLVHYIIAKLEKGMLYELYFSGPGVSKPEYDLNYFQSALPENLPVISTKQIEEIQHEQSVLNESTNIFTDKRFIWAALIVVIIFLGIVTYRMMQNMN